MATAPPQALPVDDDFGIPEFQTLANVIEASLGINREALFVWISRREPVTSVLQHEHIATNLIGYDLCNGHAMANVARVAMKHEHCHVPRVLAVCGANEEGTEGFAIRCGYQEILEVRNAELGRTWDVAARIWRKVPRIYNLRLLKVQQSTQDHGHTRRGKYWYPEIGEHAVEVFTHLARDGEDVGLRLTRSWSGGFGQWMSCAGRNHRTGTFGLLTDNGSF